MTLAASLPCIARALCVLGLSVGLLTACTPEPAPTPTPTALFASDEEAYAAAAETYQAYLEALNTVDLADPNTFEAVYLWTTDSASAAVRASLARLHEDGFRMTGESQIESVVPVSADLGAGEVTIQVCVDVSTTGIFDTNNQSVIPENRADVQALAGDLVAAETESGLAVSRTAGDETLTCSP